MMRINITLARIHTEACWLVSSLSGCLSIRSTTHQVFLKKLRNIEMGPFNSYHPNICMPKYICSFWFLYSLETRQKCKRIKENSSNESAESNNSHTYGALLFNIIFLFLLSMVLVFLGLILQEIYMPLTPCSQIHKSLIVSHTSRLSSVNGLSNGVIEYSTFKSIISSAKLFSHFVIDR